MIVSSEQAGKRLDKVLGKLLPKAGLRHRRRLCDEGRILVDGQAMTSAYKVSSGQELAVAEFLKPAMPQGLRVIKRENGFAAIFKPAGLHSAAIAGRDNSSVELFIPELLNSQGAKLLNRLDRDTSGLLLAALTNEAGEEYLRLERQGKIRKTYLARVAGRLEGDIVVRNRLDTNDRARTLVLGEEDSDFRRWTEVEVLEHSLSEGFTLVRAVIHKGARHQIRAHLASLGHPIVGDPLYGEGGDLLFLHHQHIEFSDFSAQCPLLWLE